MYRPGKDYNTDDRTLRGESTLEITNAAALPFELDGELKNSGDHITLFQTCNWPGHSPSFVGVDSDGNPLIVSFSEVRIVDRRVVPNDKMLKYSTR